MSVPAEVEVYLEINSVPLDTHAWRCLSYGDMFAAPPVRGSDRIMPGAAGRRAVRRRIDASTKSFSIHVFGYKDQDGAAIADPLEGLLTHAAYLRANLGLAHSVGDGTVPAVFHRGGLTTWTADVTVLAIADWQNIRGREATFRLDISVPAGEFTP